MVPRVLSSVCWSATKAGEGGDGRGIIGKRTRLVHVYMFFLFFLFFCEQV